MDQPDSEFRHMVEQSSDLLDWMAERSKTFCNQNRLRSFQIIAEFPRRLMWALYIQAIKYYGISGSVNYHMDERNAIVRVNIGELFLHASSQDVFRLSCPTIVRTPTEGSFEDIRLERGISQHWEIPPVFRQYDWPRMKSLITDAQRRLVKN